jgi:hypothetical protein
MSDLTITKPATPQQATAEGFKPIAEFLDEHLPLPKGVIGTWGQVADQEPSSLVDHHRAIGRIVTKFESVRYMLDTDSDSWIEYEIELSKAKRCLISGEWQAEGVPRDRRDPIIIDPSDWQALDIDSRSLNAKGDAGIFWELKLRVVGGPSEAGQARRGRPPKYDEEKTKVRLRNIVGEDLKMSNDAVADRHISDHGKEPGRTYLLGLIKEIKAENKNSSGN